MSIILNIFNVFRSRGLITATEFLPLLLKLFRFALRAQWWIQIPIFIIQGEITTRELDKINICTKMCHRMCWSVLPSIDTTTPSIYYLGEY